MDAVALAKDLWPLAAGVGGGFAAWAKWRADVRRFTSEAEAARESQKADLIGIAQRAAAGVIEDLREETDRLQKRIQALETELLTLQTNHAQVLAAKDAELTMLRGEARQKDHIIEQLDRFIRSHGLEPPKPTQVWYAIRSHGPPETEPQ